MRIVFMGTPDFAVQTLSRLAADGHEIAAVYTRAPKAAGRGMTERRSPIQVKAESLRLPVLHPGTLRGEAATDVFRAHKADAAIVVAYGLLLPKPVLEASKFGCLNLHASLLPRWRGTAPINRAIMAGDTETGIAIMRMEEGLDTGPVALVEHMPISSNVTVGELHDRLAKSGADAMARAVTLLEKGALKFKPQPESGATYAKKIDKNETRIDWTKSANEVHNHIRGLSPFPGAWFEIEHGKNRVRVRAMHTTIAEGTGQPGTVLDDRLTIACGDGAIRLIEVQRAGAKAMGAEEFLRGTVVAKKTMLPA